MICSNYVRRLYMKKTKVIIGIIVLMFSLSIVSASNEFDMGDVQDLNTELMDYDEEYSELDSEIEIFDNNPYATEGFNETMPDRTEVYSGGIHNGTYANPDKTSINSSDVPSRDSNYQVGINYPNNIYQTEYLMACLKDSNGYVIQQAGMPFKFVINNVNYTRVTNEYGLARIQINLVAQPTPYTININFNGYGSYPTIIGYISSNVYQRETRVTPITFYLNQYDNFQFKVTDNTGVPLNNKTTTITINNVNYTRRTNQYGIANITIRLDPNKYNISFQCNQQLGCQASSKTIELTVNSNITRVKTLIKALTTYVTTGNKFEVKLTDVNNVALSGKSVKFYINNVLYSRTTGSNGTAGVNINLNQGTYSFSVSFIGDSNYDCSSVYTLIHNSNSAKNNVHNISNITEYMERSDYKCDYSSPYIQSLSSELVYSCNSNLEKIISIYNYVHRINGVDYSNSTYYSLGTLLGFVGNCADHSNAFISLARSNSIPVLYVVGFCDVGGHEWCQVCIDNTWIVCEVTNTLILGEWNTANPDYQNLNYTCLSSY